VLVALVGSVINITILNPFSQVLQLMFTVKWRNILYTGANETGKEGRRQQ